jgi:hypothetical protein
LEEGPKLSAIITGLYLEIRSGIDLIISLSYPSVSIFINENFDTQSLYSCSRSFSRLIPLILLG